MLKCAFNLHFNMLKIGAALEWLGSVTVRASDLRSGVVGSIPGQAVIKLPRSTQPSIPPG